MAQVGQFCTLRSSTSFLVPRSPLLVSLPQFMGHYPLLFRLSFLVSFRLSFRLYFRLSFRLSFPPSFPLSFPLSFLVPFYLQPIPLSLWPLPKFWRFELLHYLTFYLKQSYGC